MFTLCCSKWENVLNGYSQFWWYIGLKTRRTTTNKNKQGGGGGGRGERARCE